MLNLSWTFLEERRDRPLDRLYHHRLCARRLNVRPRLRDKRLNLYFKDRIFAYRYNATRQNNSVFGA